MDYLVAGIILLLLVTVFWELLKKSFSKASNLLLNSVAGILILMFLRTFLGWDIQINAPTILICGLFGIPGVATLIILHLSGML